MLLYCWFTYCQASDDFQKRHESQIVIFQVSALTEISVDVHDWNIVLCFSQWQKLELKTE